MEKEKIIIKKELDAILKEYNRLDGGQYVAILNQLQELRENLQKGNRGGARLFNDYHLYFVDSDADALRAVFTFMHEAHMIKREQLIKLWAMIEKIIEENI